MGVVFTFSCDDDPPGGMDLGHIDITTPEATVTSRGRAPDQSMMIFLSIPLLLNALARVAKGGAVAGFTAVDSSFSLHFERVRGGVAVRHGATVVWQGAVAELLAAVGDGLSAFMATVGHRLPPDDSAREDLLAAVASFEALRRR